MNIGPDKTDSQLQQPTGVFNHFRNNWPTYGMWALGTVGSLGVDLAFGAPVASLFNPATIATAATIFGLPAAATGLVTDTVIQRGKKRSHKESEQRSVDSTPVQNTTKTLNSQPVPLLFQAHQEIEGKESLKLKRRKDVELVDEQIEHEVAIVIEQKKPAQKRKSFHSRRLPRSTGSK